MTEKKVMLSEVIKNLEEVVCQRNLEAENLAIKCFDRFIQMLRDEFDKCEINDNSDGYFLIFDEKEYFYLKRGEKYVVSIKTGLGNNSLKIITQFENTLRRLIDNYFDKNDNYCVSFEFNDPPIFRDDYGRIIFSINKVEEKRKSFWKLFLGIFSK